MIDSKRIIEDEYQAQVWNGDDPNDRPDDPEWPWDEETMQFNAEEFE